MCVLALGVGAARPATIRGTLGPDRLVGTARPDTIFGRAGADTLAVSDDTARDTVRCGAGRDVVVAELADAVGPSCEIVTRQLSRDPFTNEEGQHQTQVEPDSYAVGSTIVTAFQAGRMDDGGASGIGFATSKDGGAHWRSGFLPSLTTESKPPGDAPSASDPVVAYDAQHGVWLIATVAESEVRVRTLVSRSKDGVTWGAPVTAAGDPAEDDDKEWVVCDNGLASPFRGRCYLSYLDARSAEIRTRISTDGGLSWSAPAVTAPRTELGFVNGAQPVVRPDGTLVVVFDLAAGGAHFADPAASQIQAARSTDGGRTFGPVVTVARVQAEDVQGIRAPTLPSADVDSGGMVYVAWGDCRFRDECTVDDIVVSRSHDGIAWTPPERVPLVGQGSDVQAFVPGLAVDPTTGGSTAHVAVVAYTQAESCSYDTCRGIGVAFASSRNGGRSWTAPRRLDAEPMSMLWLPDTGLGRMLGDYVSTSYVRGRPVPVFALAVEPFGGQFREAIYASTRIR